MQELIKVELNERQEPFVSGRELHEVLEVNERYTQWFDRMKEYGFTENIDFTSLSEISEKPQGGRPKQDHAIKIDMAKELCMIQRTERGKQARKYFIEVEKEFNSPERIMARALIIAEKQIESLKLTNKTLETTIEENKPKVLFADAVSASHTSILVGELAKILKQNGYNTGQQRLFEELRERDFLMKAGSSRNMPTQRAMEMGLFEIKETTINNPDGSIRVNRTTKVTGKGQQYFINMFVGKVKEA